MKNTIKYISVALALTISGVSAFAAGGGVVPPKQEWSWTGFTGTFDKKQLQRGLQVYTEVCAGCHSLNLMSYRNLTSLGYTIAEVKKFAAEFEVQDGPDAEGEMFMRPARPSDAFVAPFANDNAARAANNGALPPDLSLIVKARATGKHSIATNLWNSLKGFGAGSGSDYVYALLTGYDDEPDDFTISEGMSYNTYFPGHQIAMAMPIDDEAVEYADGTEATQDQIARDITAFLSWASEPELEHRKQMGMRVLIFLAIFWFIVLLYKKRVWADVKKG